MSFLILTDIFFFIMYYMIHSIHDVDCGRRLPKYFIAIFYLLNRLSHFVCNSCAISVETMDIMDTV